MHGLLCEQRACKLYGPLIRKGKIIGVSFEQIYLDHMFVEKVWRFYSVEQLFSIFSGAFYMNLFRKKKKVFERQRHTKRRERQRQRKRKSSSAGSQMALHKHLRHLLLLFRHSIRELDQKQSRKDLNQCPYGTLFSQMAAQPAMPGCCPLFFALNMH